MECLWFNRKIPDDLAFEDIPFSLGTFHFTQLTPKHYRMDILRFLPGIKLTDLIFHYFVITKPDNYIIGCYRIGFWFATYFFKNHNAMLRLFFYNSGSLRKILHDYDVACRKRRCRELLQRNDINGAVAISNVRNVWREYKNTRCSLNDFFFIINGSIQKDSTVPTFFERKSFRLNISSILNKAWVALLCLHFLRELLLGCFCSWFVKFGYQHAFVQGCCPSPEIEETKCLRKKCKSFSDNSWGETETESESVTRPHRKKSSQVWWFVYRYRIFNSVKSSLQSTVHRKLHKERSLIDYKKTALM